MIKNRFTHCKNGHEFSAANTYTSQQGYRQCIICNRENSKRYNRRIKKQKLVA